MTMDARSVHRSKSGKVGLLPVPQIAGGQDSGDHFQVIHNFSPRYWVSLSLRLCCFRQIRFLEILGIDPLDLGDGDRAIFRFLGRKLAITA